MEKSSKYFYKEKGFVLDHLIKDKTDPIRIQNTEKNSHFSLISFDRSIDIWPSYVYL